MQQNPQCRGKYAQGISRQRGVALFIALVVLLIITIIGVAGLQTTRFEERMAANARDHQIAFQAAETALRTAELALEALAPGFAPSFDANANGRYRPAAPTATPRWEAANWTGDASIPQVAADVGTVAAPPKYILEYLAQVAFQQDVNNQGGYGEGEPELADIFRVTAHGTGGSTDARVLLQSTYGKLAQ